MSTRGMTALVLGLCAPGAALADEGTGPSQPMLQPGGTWKGDTAALPGAPAGCRARVTVEVPYKACKDEALAAWVNQEDLAASRSRAAELGITAEQSSITYRATASQGPTGATACSFGCFPATRTARWFVSVDEDGYRGAVACEVGGVLHLALELGEPGAAVPGGIGEMWLTDLSHFRFQVRRTGAEATLSGDNLCPAGQPTREGGPVGAFVPGS